MDDAFLDHAQVRSLREMGILQVLIPTFLTDLSEAIEQIEEDAAASRWQAVFAKAHELKGASLMLGLRGLGDASQRICDATQAGDAAPAELLDDLERAAQIARALLVGDPTPRVRVSAGFVQARTSPRQRLSGEEK